jgi:hypothetical protein
MCKCTECKKHSVQGKKILAQAVSSATPRTKHSTRGPSGQFLDTLGTYKTLGAKDLYQVFLEHSGQKNTLGTYLTLKRFSMCPECFLLQHSDGKNTQYSFNNYAPRVL